RSHTVFRAGELAVTWAPPVGREGESVGRSDALLLGIDIGTSGCKTVVVDEEGSLAAWSYAEYELYSDGHGRSEQEPADWWNAVQQTIRDIMHRHPEFRSRLRGIGLSGQMHGLVPLDQYHRVIR